MKFHNFIYLLKQGVKSITQNKLMSFSCIGVLVACMLLIGSATLFTASVNNIAGELQKQTDIVAYLEEGVSSSQIDNVNQELEKIENISEIHFTSQEEVLDDMKGKMGRYGTFFEGLSPEDNPFPGTYVLRLSDPSLTENTVKKVESIPGILEVRASMEVAELLGEIKQIVYYSGSGVVIILILVSLAIITNTIKISIYSRRREINIMKYVGATDTFIRLPFIIEGMVMGLLAALFSFGLLGVGYTYLLDWASINYGQMYSMLFSNAISFKELAVEILLGFTAIGVGIGMLSSGVFVRKHLRV